MSTYKEVAEEIRTLRRRLAVWEAIHHVMDDKFISRDGRKAAAIKVLELAEAVPEEVIEDVLQNIAEGPISDLKEQIENLENQQVVVLGETKAQA